MSIQTYFNRKKKKFLTFFTQLKSTIEKVSLAVQLQIDRQYDVASQVLRQSSQIFIQNQCNKMQKKETDTLYSILDQIFKDLKQSILNPAHFVYREISVSDFKSKFHNSPRKVQHRSLSQQKVNYHTGSKKYQSAHRNIQPKIQRQINDGKAQRSFSGTKIVSKDYDICQKLDYKLQSQAKQYLLRSQNRKKQNQSRKKLSRNIISMQSSSISYNNQISKFLNQKNR